MPEVRRGGCVEITLVQGKEQRLCFAGAAVKRYPTSKIRVEKHCIINMKQGIVPYKKDIKCPKGI